MAMVNRQIRLFFVYAVFFFGFSLTFLNQVQAQAETDLPLKGLTIICDLDYTFLDYDSRAELYKVGERSELSERLRQLFKPLRVVNRMDHVLMTLQNKGAEIVFISARPTAHHRLIRKFLDAVGFSKARLQLFDQSASTNIMNYKSSQILEYARNNPEQKMILIGDNLELDVEIFGRLLSQESMVGKILMTMIRVVRRSRPVPKEHFQFEDGSGIASLLQKIGLLTPEEARIIHAGKKINPRQFATGMCLDLF